MAQQAYIKKKFGADALGLIETCAGIIREYRGQRLKLSLRQLYYQLVSRAVISNTEKSYKRIGGLVSDARLAGLLDWSAIEDRVRVPWQPSEWDNVQQIVAASLNGYRLPRLEGQKTYPELWVEKDALAGVLQPIASDYHVTLCVNRGYSSSSAMYESARRISNRCRSQSQSNDRGDVIRPALILYLGDFDPSGEDMVRDVQDRLNRFLQGSIAEEESELNTDPKPCEDPAGWNLENTGTVEVEVEKIALTKDQIKQYNPPPNPAKLTDSRAAAFVAEHGSSSWEVDALRPEVLAQIVRDALDDVIDGAKVETIIQTEERDKTALREAASSLMNQKRR